MPIGDLLPTPDGPPGADILGLVGIGGAALVGLLLVAPWPFWRLAASTAVNQRRRDQFALLLVLGGYGLGVVLVALIWTALLPVLASLAAAVALALWWRSRVKYGSRAGVPPGRILVHPLGHFEAEDQLRRLSERYGPIFKIGATFPVPTLTPIICIVGHDLGLELLRNHEASLESFPPFPVSRLIPRGFMRDMTTVDHERYAPLFRHAVANCADSEFKRAVVSSAQNVLSRMEADSDADGVDPRPYLRDFAFDVLARLHFGFASGSAEQARLGSELGALGIARFWRWSPEVARRTRWSRTVDQIESEFRPPAAVGSVLGAILAETMAKDRDTVYDSGTIVGNVLQMQESGTGDLSSLLVWVVKHLGDHPDWLDRLALETPEPGRRSLGESVIRESLRLEQSEYLFRRATKDITFQGHLLPKGWRIRVCVREAHRDPAIFNEPLEFNPARFLDQTFALSAFAPFGLFRHRCVGAQVVYLVGRIFVEELARSYRLSIIDDGPRQHGRFHWQPNSRLRVFLWSRSMEDYSRQRQNG